MTEVRFYGGVFHGESRHVKQFEDRLIIYEGYPYSLPHTMSEYAEEAVPIRHHRYRRLWLSLGDDTSSPFSVFVYEGWD